MSMLSEWNQRSSHRCPGNVLNSEAPSPLASFSSKATHYRESVDREQKSQGLLRIPGRRQVIRPVISSQRMVIKVTFHHSDGGNSHPRGGQ